MEEEKIVKLFLENGFQLSKSALSTISSDPESLISELNKMKPRPFIVTDEHIKKIQKKSNPSRIEIRTLKEFTANKSPLHVNDYVKHMISRYEKLRSILIEQVPPRKLMCINKITPKISGFSVIARIKDKRDNSIVVEDPTGETTFYWNKNMEAELKNVLVDDVVGIECEKLKERYYIKKITYPDVLSSRNVTKTKEEMSIVFLSLSQDLTEQKTKKLIDYLSGVNSLSTVFVFGRMNSHILNNKLSGVYLIQIPMMPTSKLFQLGKIKILTIPNTFLNCYFQHPTAPEIFTSILKRRELLAGDSHVLSAYMDSSLKEIPDIIASDFGGSTSLNYKGTTIIFNSDPEKVFTVNLRTREVEQFSF